MSIKKYSNGAWSEVGYKKYGTETDTITTLPKTIIGDGTAISSYTIKGAMSQSGTPTPTNPIYPTECGDKTANLFDNDYRNAYVTSTGEYGSPDNTTASIVVSCNPNTEYTIKRIDSLGASAKWRIAVFANAPTNGAQGTLLVNDDSISESTITTLSDSRYIVVYYQLSNPTQQMRFMVNQGSTPLPYEPYGYKIPISLGNYAYPIYISEPLRKSLDGSNVYDTIESNGVLTRRVDANGDALATPTTEQITVPTLPTTGTAEQFDVDTTLKPSEVQLTYHGWHEHSDEKYVGGVINEFNKDDVDGGKYSIQSNGEIAPGVTSYAFRVPCKPSTAYNVSFALTSAVESIWRISITDSASYPIQLNVTGNLVAYDTAQSAQTKSTTFTTGAESKYIWVQTTAAAKDTIYDKLMIVESSTAPSEYHPYYEWVEQS